MKNTKKYCEYKDYSDYVRATLFYMFLGMLQDVIFTFQNQQFTNLNRSFYFSVILSGSTGSQGK